MNKIYISGPMSGLPDHNFPAFFDAEKDLRESFPGAEILNPARNFDGALDLPYATYMRKDIELLLQATTIFLLPGWEKSRGANIELAIAQALDLEVLTRGACNLPPKGWACTRKPGHEGSCAAIPTGEEKEHRGEETTPPGGRNQPMGETKEHRGETVLEEAQRICLTARGDDYGHPLDDYTRVAGAFNALTGHTLTPEEAVVFMICVKLSRESHAPKRDNRVDGPGYFFCLDRIHEERHRRNQNTK